MGRIAGDGVDIGHGGGFLLADLLFGLGEFGVQIGFEPGAALRRLAAGFGMGGCWPSACARALASARVFSWAAAAALASCCACAAAARSLSTLFLRDERMPATRGKAIFDISR